MKSLRDLSVKQLATVLLATVFIILVAEYLGIRSTVHTLQQIEDQTDFTRLTQIKNQHLALQWQHYKQGQTEISADIIARLNEQDHRLNVMATGNRIDGTDTYFKPLSRLEKITFDNLLVYWNQYKENMQALLAETEVAEINTLTSPATIPSDSTQAEIPISNIAVSSVKSPAAMAKAEGLWLTVNTWYDRLLNDINEKRAHASTIMDRWFIFFSFLDLGLLVGIFWFFNKFIIQPIKLIEVNTAAQHPTLGFPANEIGSVALKINETLEHLKDATEFVQKIGEGNLTIRYQELDAHYKEGKNRLADTLISMQGKLKALNDEEQKRQWSNEGLARFVDILRSSNDNIHKLGDEIISALVKYTGSNQGGLYTLNDDNNAQPYLELISLFAFENKKFEKQKVKLGEGILGQTFLEKETTYLKEIPEEYIRITSGLGDAPPKSILIVPLKVDLQIYGIVELASFKDYHPHEIAFVEKLGETIASTLASVKSAQRNRQLIEQFQEQTEVMRAQEEEMRQNMEELQATQEEIARKERDYIARIAELEEQSDKEDAKKELATLKSQLSMQAHEYAIKIKDLEGELAEKPVKKGEDWEIALDVEKTLRINLEALTLTQNELNKKLGNN